MFHPYGISFGLTHSFPALTCRPTEMSTLSGFERQQLLDGICNLAKIFL